MENRYIITLSTSDKLIAVWKSKALKAGQEKMSTLVKNAILAFIEQGEFIDIGHIHFPPDNEEVKKGDVILLQTARTPIISRWIEENKAAGLGISEPIKLLLSKCIKIVPDTEAEYFPSPNKSRKYSESNIIRLMKENAAKITEQGISSIRKPEKSEKVTMAPSELPVIQAANTVEPLISKTSISTNGGLENDQVFTGLNSLLPQRATKKK